MVNGEKAVGYLDEQGIPRFIYETYAALCLYIENWRWKGVPLRSGRNLQEKAKLQFNLEASRDSFGEDERFSLTPNLLVIRIQPNEGVTLYLNSKTPGLETKLQPIQLSFGYETTFGSNTPEAYERLILDALNGDGTLFIRGDEAEISWNLLSPILDFWSQQATDGLEIYSAGTWGL